MIELAVGFLVLLAVVKGYEFARAFLTGGP